MGTSPSPLISLASSFVESLPLPLLPSMTWVVVEAWPLWLWDGEWIRLLSMFGVREEGEETGCMWWAELLGPPPPRHRHGDENRNKGSWGVRQIWVCPNRKRCPPGKRDPWRDKEVVGRERVMVVCLIVLVKEEVVAQVWVGEEEREEEEERETERNGEGERGKEELLVHLSTVEHKKGVAC